MSEYESGLISIKIYEDWKVKGLTIPAGCFVTYERKGNNIIIHKVER